MCVLVTPLDWGLGHATRCIPVVRELMLQGCDVLLAGSGDALTLLQQEFPSLRTFTLPGYQPRYPHHGSMVWTMALQLPRFMRVIAGEHRAITRIVAQEKVRAIISDNRYGCWSPEVPSIFLTHQSNILMPRRFGWLQHGVRRMNNRMINHFHQCWIPDVPGERSLAGALAGFRDPGITIKKEYVGWLSRFTGATHTKEKYDVVAVLSGPEPQRTALEDVLVPQLRRSALRYRVVRGLPSSSTPQPDDRMVDFLPSEALQQELEAASLVVARSGFSTVMDMQALGKKVVFIPTPGQTEQEYLAKRLMEQGISFFMTQRAFDLSTALDESRRYSGFTPMPANTLLRKAVSALLDR